MNRTLTAPSLTLATAAVPPLPRLLPPSFPLPSISISPLPLIVCPVRLAARARTHTHTRAHQQTPFPPPSYMPTSLLSSLFSSWVPAFLRYVLLGYLLPICCLCRTAVTQGCRRCVRRHAEPRTSSAHADAHPPLFAACAGSIVVLEVSSFLFPLYTPPAAACGLCCRSHLRARVSPTTAGGGLL